jgi:hypothetical protein
MSKNTKTQDATKTTEKRISKSLAERAREAENQWRADLGLGKSLHRRGNAMAGQRRRHAECPIESNCGVRYRRYRNKQLGKLGAASKARRVDPNSH